MEVTSPVLNDMLGVRQVHVAGTTQASTAPAAVDNAVNATGGPMSARSPPGFPVNAPAAGQPPPPKHTATQLTGNIPPSPNAPSPVSAVADDAAGAAAASKGTPPAVAGVTIVDGDESRPIRYCTYCCKPGGCTDISFLRNAFQENEHFRDKLYCQDCIDHLTFVMGCRDVIIRWCDRCRSHRILIE